MAFPKTHFDLVPPLKAVVLSATFIGKRKALFSALGRSGIPRAPRLSMYSLSSRAGTACFFVSAFLLSLATLPPPHCSATEASQLVIVFPGGPNPGSSGQRAIDEFVAKLGEQIGGNLEGNYFNDSAAAFAHLEKNPNSFVLGSTGFFLAYRESLKLIPMARVMLPDGKPEQYFLVTKKGAFTDLASLQNKRVTGTPFFENPAFLDRIAFDGAIKTESFFEAEGTNRPLSALRKLTSGDIDGVLLAATQFHSLASLPLAEELDVVFQSRPVPSVGLMRLDNEATETTAEALRQALLDLSKTPEGIEASQGFGVAGFAEIDAGEIAALVKKYEDS